jgi:hypothetical protein
VGSVVDNCLKVRKIADSVALILVVKCGCFVCCGVVWISARFSVSLFLRMQIVNCC